MPYSSVKDVPEYVKKYSPVIQRQWMHVFNSVYKRTSSERRAFMAANSVLKKRFKRARKHNESHSDYFNYLIDSYLGNLEG